MFCLRIRCLGLTLLSQLEKTPCFSVNYPAKPSWNMNTELCLLMRWLMLHNSNQMLLGSFWAASSPVGLKALTTMKMMTDQLWNQKKMVSPPTAESLQNYLMMVTMVAKMISMQHHPPKSNSMMFPILPLNLLCSRVQLLTQLVSVQKLLVPSSECSTAKNVFRVRWALMKNIVCVRSLDLIKLQSPSHDECVISFAAAVSCPSMIWHPWFGKAVATTGKVTMMIPCVLLKQWKAQSNCFDKLVALMSTRIWCGLLVESS